MENIGFFFLHNSGLLFPTFLNKMVFEVPLNWQNILKGSIILFLKSKPRHVIYFTMFSFGVRDLIEISLFLF